MKRNTARLRTGLMALVLLLSLASAARADVLWEPNNSFYERHAGECTYVGRVYLANGAEGYVTVWNAPNGSSVQAQYENGTRLLVYWRCGDWGCITRWEEDNREISGWIPLADLALTYDHIAFEAEYGQQIRTYDGEFAGYSGDAAVVNFYEYPGAPSVKESRDTSQWYGSMDGLTGGEDGYSYIQSIFTDEDGLTWGYVAYMYGHVDAWFCLDDPDGENFPVRQVDTEPLIPAQTPVMPVKGVVSGVLPWVLVAAVVAVTGALLWVRRKKA